MKKSTMALLIAVTVLFSGAAGLGGTYLGNLLASNFLAGSREAASSPAAEGLASGQHNEGAEPAGSGGDDAGGALASEPPAPGDDISSLIAVSGGKGKQELTIPEIAALTASSVVEIYTETVTRSGRMGQYVTEGAGSGVIITADGYVMTNNHVIDGANKITVRLNDGTDYEAELIGRDSKTDIAVLKIDASGLSTATFGDSDKLVVGELVIAIGNPLGSLGGSVTEGIISALSRNIEIDGNLMTLLQTTAAVNPGNSGGGLFNRFGELVGVVNAKSSGSDIEGIGFAIPANLAKAIAEDLVKHGYVPGRVDFGATLVNVLDSVSAMIYRVPTTGVYVSQADNDNQLQSGDRIVSIDGKEIKSIADINDLLDGHKAGDTLSITVARSGSDKTFDHVLKQAMY